MTLDGLQYLFMGAVLPLAIYLITQAFPISRKARWIIGGILVSWFAVTALTAVPSIGRAPGALFGIIFPVVAISLWMVLNSAARKIVLQATLPLLIILHVTRVAGGLFIPLFWEGRLTNPFAYIAGGGDLLSAALAIPAAYAAWQAKPGWEKWVLAWNVIGFADFMSAITLGITSQQGSPFQVFMDAPGTSILGQLPWRFIPSYFVPLYIMVHVAIFIRLLLPQLTPQSLINQPARIG
jgi:hypothetical protein